MRIFTKGRSFLARKIERQLLSWPVSIVADDCWAAELYGTLKLLYLTPVVGLWIQPSDYIRFVRNLRSKDAFDLTFIQSRETYPVARTPYATLHFMHYASESEAKDKFSRRATRLNWDRIYTKIDFGKPGYTMRDVDEWNWLKLPNSVAFYPNASEFSERGIHNGVAISDWTLNGAAMFQISKMHFDLFRWLRCGEIRATVRNRLIQRFLRG
jgi:uncharacterized protein (DUF1919 family)